MTLTSSLLPSCNEQPAKTTESQKNAVDSFSNDLAFLKSHDPNLVVLQNGKNQVVVSAKYQAKVFTSTTDGEQSFGWIHYKAFDGPLDPHMNAYGGENRLWLGPEGGPFSLFFAAGTKQVFDNWHTPAGFDSEPWELVQPSSSPSSSNQASATTVTLRKDMHLTNYSGTKLSLRVDRRISLLNQEGIDSLLRIRLTSDVQAVAYRAENTVTNTGDKSWDESTGLPCMWILDMFPPSDHTTIVIPYKPTQTEHSIYPAPATTDYFGEIPPDRIKFQDSVLFLRADGKYRGKLGIHPERASPVAGSYDSDKHVLTIIRFDTDPLGRYLNQEWRTDKPLFSGDAMNAYNDGPLTDGPLAGTQMGPFYELESVSTALYLPPGHSATHWHSVFHFTGNEQSLSQLSQQILGVSIDQINGAFK